MPLSSIDYDDLEKRDLVHHHHYIACKDYDRTIMTKLNFVKECRRSNGVYKKRSIRRGLQ